MSDSIFHLKHKGLSLTSAAIFNIALSLGLIGCGGSSDVGTTTPTAYTIDVTISGLSGDSLVLQNNASDDLSISSDGNYTFSTALTNSSAYDVTVLNMPTNPGQICTISNATGTVQGSNISKINVTCLTNTYTVGGTVLGLTGEVIIRNNNTDELTITSNGAYTFQQALDDGSDFTVSIISASAGYSCIASNKTSSINGANIENVDINCANNMPPTAKILPVSVPFESTTPIVITFDRSMSPSSLILAGGLVSQSDNGTWSTTNSSNDTLTISPNTSWAISAGSSLTVDAEDTVGTRLFPTLNPYGTIYFVDNLAADDTGDGLTISTAKKTIRSAVDSAIWPATVLVNTGEYNVNSDTTGTQTHVVLKERVSLSGGYSPNFNARDTTLYPSTITDNSSETKGGVGTAPPSNGIESVSGISNATVVDGFTINGTVQSGADYSAAILISDGAPIIQNNILNGGGGSTTSRAIDIRGSNVPVITNNFLNGGSDTSNYGLVTTASAIIHGNTIEAAFGLWTGYSSAASIYNNIINGTAYGIINNNSSSIITNNTLYSIGTGIGIYNQNTSSSTIMNNIIAYPSCIQEYGANSDPAVIKNNNLYSCTVVYVDDEAGCTGNADGDNNSSTCTFAEMEALSDFSPGAVNGNISIDPLLVDVDGIDNDIKTMGDNDWHLQASSPVNIRQGGLNLADSYTSDFDNVTRTAVNDGSPTNTNAAGWSIGAYEKD